MRSAMARVRKKGAPPSELSRDIYGFIVKPQHVQRYREFASIYKEEEAERSERWDHFLETYNVPGSKTEETQPDHKQEPEDEKPRRVQRWSELRPSLNIVEQAVNSGEINSTKPPTTTNNNNNNNIKQANGEAVKLPRKAEASDDDSDDEFYDLDKGDGDSSAPSDHSDTETPPVRSQDCPWREELQFLVRGGVPMALRGELWQVFVRTKSRRVEGHYDFLLAEKPTSGNGNANGDSHEAGDVEKYAAQIEKDLPRTFPGHPALDEDGRNALRRLLIAYARHNPDVGYCQAMNFFAGLLLLLMPEENAFWTLAGIIDEYFEGYYSEKLLEAQVDQLVFEELTRGQFPRLISHLESIGVQVPWISGPWFLSIFVNVLPWESVLRVWDVLLFEGNRTMLFRTALALLELHAPALMATRDAGDFISLMQTLASSTFDSSQLVLTACMGFQKIDQQQLQSLRTKHRPAVLATLDERALELRLWRNSQAALAKKLSRKFSVLDKASAAEEDGLLLSASSDVLESEILDEEDEEDEEKYSTDLEEQVLWLKNELSLALEEKKRANARAEELDLALMEIVKEDNRRELSAKVEKLEAELAEARQMLSDKQEQEKAMLQVMLRVEQEQKIAEDARRFAEQDAAAQRQAATRLQEKYEEAMDKLAAAEKRAVMAETMLEATLQYEAGQPGGARRQPKEDETSGSKWSWSLGSPKTSSDSANKPKSESPNTDGVKSAEDENNRKPGLFSRMNWRDRNKGKAASPVQSREEEKEEANTSDTTPEVKEKSPAKTMSDQAEAPPPPVPSSQALLLDANGISLQQHYDSIALA